MTVGARAADDVLDATIAGILKDFVERWGCPGVAVSVFGVDGPICRAAAGVRSVEHREPLTTDTLFGLESVTKFITCTAALMLVDQGYFRLDEPIDRFLPRDQAVDPLRSITLRQLLTHTSGLGRGGLMTTAVRGSGTGRGSLGVRYALHAGLVEPPGRLYDYSGPGITLVGALIEIALDDDFEHAIDELVRGPFNLPTLTFDPTVAMTRALSQRHRSRDGLLEVVHRPFQRVALPAASGGYASVVDLERLGIAHLRAQAAAPGSSSLQLMAEPQSELGLDVNLRYGLGCYTGPRYGTARSYGQVGYFEGSWARLTLLADDPWIGLAWCDSLGNDDIPIEVRQRVQQEILGHAGVLPARWEREVPVADEEPRNIQGLFRRAVGRGVVVEVEAGGKVSIGNTDFLAETVLLPSGVRVYVDDGQRPRALPWRPHDYSRRCCFTFLADEQGEASHLVLNGTPFRRVDLGQAGP